MTETYDPDLLVTFLAVAETGSFSEAARRRGLRQSTVSQQVRRLEAETRRRLFDRDTHNVALTVDGQALTVLAGEILAAYSRARALFLERRAQGSGPLRRLGGFRALEPAAAGPARFCVEAPSGRHRDDGRARRRSLRRHGRGRARPHFRQAPGGRRSRPHGVARRDGLDRSARLAARPGAPAAARPLSAAQHHPRGGSRGARESECLLAHRLHLRLAFGPCRRRAGRPWRRRAIGASEVGRDGRRRVPRRGCRRSARRSSSLSPRSAGRARRSRRWRTRSSSSAALSMRKRPGVSELHRKDRSSARAGSA